MSRCIGAGAEKAVERRWATVLMLFIATLLLLWPAAINRQPFLFADTTAYVRGADAALFKATGRASPWTQELLRRLPSPASSSPSLKGGVAPASRTSSQGTAVLSGRSIYYGLFLYLLLLPGSFWPVAIAQALLTAVCLLVTWRRVAHPTGWPSQLFLPLIAVLSVATPLAYFVCYAMPDLFAGLGVLASAMLLTMRSERRGYVVFWCTLLVAAALFHSGILLLIGGLLVVAGALAAMRLIHLNWLGVGAVCFALIGGILGEAAFGVAVARTTGMPPVRPPFVMARLIDDGPGFQYLRQTCPLTPKAYVVCRYLDRLPLNSDAFLWNAAVPGGVFMTVPVTEQRALSREQFRFMLDVIVHWPVAQATATMRNLLYQLSMIGLPEFRYDPGMDAFLSKKLPPLYLEQHRNTLAFHGRMPITPTTILTVLSILGSLIAIALSAARGHRSWRNLSTPNTTAMLMIAGLLINAAICGGMSTPHDRYEARVIWLLPIAAIFAWSDRRRRTVSLTTAT